MKLHIIEKHFIYKLGSISAPSCHASTVVKMNDGRLAAAWFAGTNESNPDVRIWFSIKDDAAWDLPRPLTPDDNIADWNPVLHSDSTGKIMLMYKSGLTPRTWVTMVILSDDFGSTWTEPRELVHNESMPRGPVKNKMIQLDTGRLVAPASDESADERWAVFFDISDNNGKTWQRTEHLAITPLSGGNALTYENLTPKSLGLIQPTVWEHPKNSGDLFMLARSSFGYAYRSKSQDAGISWEKASATTIPNNNSGIDAVMTDSGVLALLYNPISQNWGPRWPITLSLSQDNGHTWPFSVDLDTEEGEYSYPAIISYGAELYMTYTYKRKTIQFIKAIIEF